MNGLWVASFPGAEAKEGEKKEPGNEARFVGITIFCVFVTHTPMNVLNRN